MAKKNFYVVCRGRHIGIYTNWTDCEKEIDGFSEADYKGFKTLEEAEQWFQQRTGQSLHQEGVVLAEKSVKADAAIDEKKISEDITTKTQNCQKEKR